MCCPASRRSGSRRTSAFRLTIRRTPMASEMVTTAGSASGTTATASAMPNMNISITGRPRSRPMATTSDDHRERRLAQRGAQAIEVVLQRRPCDLDRFHHAGDLPELRRHAGGDDQALPAAVHDQRARVAQVPPVAQRQPRDPRRDRPSSAPAADSPVSAPSSMARLIACISRVSAGTRSPARSTTTSPGTRSRAGMTVSSPSRSTRATGAAILRKASSARPARYS